MNDTMILDEIQRSFDEFKTAMEHADASDSSEILGMSHSFVLAVATALGLRG